MNPPAGGLILKQYRRVLHKDADGRLYRRDIYHDSLWMTRAEWQSLVPEGTQVPIELNQEKMARFRPKLEKLYSNPKKYRTYLDQLGIHYPTVQQSPASK